MGKSKWEHTITINGSPVSAFGLREDGDSKEEFDKAFAEWLESRPPMGTNVLSLNPDNPNQARVFLCLRMMDEAGVHCHAQTAMGKLADEFGFTILGYEPQSIADGWEFWIEFTTPPTLPNWFRHGLQWASMNAWDAAKSAQASAGRIGDEAREIELEKWTKTVRRKARTTESAIEILAACDASEDFDSYTVVTKGEPIARFSLIWAREGDPPDRWPWNLKQNNDAVRPDGMRVVR